MDVGLSQDTILNIESFHATERVRVKGGVRSQWRPNLYSETTLRRPLCRRAVDDRTPFAAERNADLTDTSGRALRSDVMSLGDFLPNSYSYLNVTRLGDSVCIFP